MFFPWLSMNLAQLQPCFMQGKSSAAITCSRVVEMSVMAVPLPMCVASLATNSGQPELSSSTQWLLFVSVCNQSAAAGLTGSCRTPAPAPWRVEVEHVAWRTSVPAATPLRHAAVWRVLAAARKSRRSPVAQRTVQVGSQTMFVALY